jgi:hypothetical protein
MSSRDGLRERSWRTAIGEGVVVAAEERAVRESQAGVTGDARAWVAGALASSPSTKEKGMRSRGRGRTESDLAVGHDQDLGGSC